MQNIVGHVLVLALIGVPGPLNEDQVVFGSGRHVIIEIAQKLGRVSVREIVVGAHEQGTVMGDLRSLGEVAASGCVDVVEKARELPVIGSIGDALHPAHEGEGQHFVAIAASHLIFDHHFLPARHAGHHISEVSRRELERKVVGITATMLTKCLRELERDGFITRKQYNTIPPTVEYSLAERGRTLIPALESVYQWADEQMKK